MLCGIFFTRRAFFIGMDLFELRVGESGRVLSVNAPPALRERLCALGVGVGKKVCVLRYSLLKSSLMVETEETVLALRREIAKKTEVERIGGTNGGTVRTVGAGSAGSTDSTGSRTGNFVGRQSEYGQKHPF
jgi:Fe2+ transport system protein FeoA